MSALARSFPFSFATRPAAYALTTRSTIMAASRAGIAIPRGGIDVVATQKESV